MSNVRNLASTCERCQSRLQAVSELLILSCDARPLRTDPSFSRSSATQIAEKIFGLMKNIKSVMKSIVNNVHMISTKYSEICEGLQDLSAVVIRFMEHCSHLAYMRAMTHKDCCQAIPGLVDKYSVCSAGLEIKLSCTRLRKTRTEELSPQLIIDLCSNISKHISLITDICRSAGEKVRDESTQDQFKLCVKSVTCAAGCLIASIKSYKSNPNERHHSRVLVFCEPVLASSQALVNFATENDFIGHQATLTSEAKDTQKAVLGACMSIVSAAIQLCKTVRDLAYDMMTSHHRDRLRMCIDAVDRVTSQMGELLNKRSSGNKFPAKGGHLDISPNSTPGHLANLFHQRRLYDRSPESPPSDRFSELLREQCVQSGTPPEKAKQDNGLSADLSPTPGEAIAQSRAFPAREAEEESSHITGNSGSIDGSSDRDSGHSSASR